MPSIRRQFVTRTIEPQGTMTFELFGSGEWMMGPYRLHVEGVGSKGTALEPFILSLSMGDETVITNRWRREMGEFEGRVFGPGHVVCLVLKNPYGSPITVHATLEGQLYAVKPPLGVVPRHLWKRSFDLLSGATKADALAVRAIHLRQAVARYERAGRLVPPEWLLEIDELSARLEPKLPPAPPSPYEQFDARTTPHLHAREKKLAADRSHGQRWSIASERQQAALQAYGADVDGSLARQLEMNRPVDEPEDAAWESPSDEWP